MKIEITTLGRFAVRVNDMEVPEFSAQPVRSSLLVYLAVAGEASRDVTMSLLRPDSDTSRARHALRQNLYELKRTLGEGWLETPGELLRIGGAVSVDAVNFKQAAEDAAYDEALEIYTGPFLDGWYLGASVEFQHWVDTEREILSHLHGKVCRGRVEECLTLGDRAGALDAAERWSSQDPLGAEAQHLLISLLLQNADPHGALRHYRRYEARLRRDEIEPLPASVHLLKRIQRAVQSASAGPGGTRGTPPPDGVGIGAAEPRVAVLPFEHLGAPEERHFTEGFTDELINHLARIPEMAVIARTSVMQYGRTNLPPGRIGEELGVSHIVTGTVRWNRSGTRHRVRISPTLIRVEDDVEVWAEMYEVSPGHGFGVQREVAERIAKELGGRLEGTPSVPRRPLARRELQAYELYLRGFQYANRRTDESLKEAVRLFQEALGLQPGFPRAFAGLAHAYAVIPGFLGVQPGEWYPKAKLAAQKALALDPDLAEAHTAMAI